MKHLKIRIIQTTIIAFLLIGCSNGNNKNATSTDSNAPMPFAFGETLPSPPFDGEAFIHPMISFDSIYNFPTTNCITFSPSSHSQWHRHGAMIVIGVGGIGLMQIEGEEPRLVYPGDVVEIPAGKRHFHGAAINNWFQQLVIYDSKWQSSITDEDNNLSNEVYATLMPQNTNSITPYADNLTFRPSDTMLSLPTFNGKIRLSNLMEGDNVAQCPGLHYVVFEPGVINAWHSHEGGQILLVSGGVGYHQIEGQPVEVLHPGDVAMCPPGVKHWHGASHNSRFAHLAANTNPDKPGVEWFDMLSKEQYDMLPKE